MTTALHRATADLLPVGDVFHVPLDRIVASPFQPRQLFPEEQLHELSEDIRSKGLLHAIVLRPHPTRANWFEVVSGERRWRAVGMGKWTETIEAKVRQLTDLEAAQIALTENIQRSSLTPYEEAQGLVILTRELELAQVTVTNAELARRIKKSEAYVSQTLSLLAMPQPFLEVAKKHRLVKSSLLEIHQHAPAEAQTALLELVDNGASFKTVKAAVEQAKVEANTLRESSAMGADRETASRASAVAAGGSGTMSRGLQLTGGGYTRTEARSEVSRSIKNIEAALQDLSDHDFKQLLQPFCREVLRGKYARD